jgi:hypothetical protein
MIERVEVRRRESEATGNPWCVLVDEYPVEVARFSTRYAAEAHAGGRRGYRVERHELAPAGWVVEVHTIGGGMDGGGFTFSGAYGVPFLTKEEGEAAAEQYRARIGVIDQGMMGSSVFEVVTLRVQAGRWTAALGVGGHTIHVRGSYETQDEAREAAEKLRQDRWHDRIWYWTRVGVRAGLNVLVVADLPRARVVRPQLGESAWAEGVAA